MTIVRRLTASDHARWHALWRSLYDTLGRRTSFIVYRR
jgi:hypothetical protein